MVKKIIFIVLVLAAIGGAIGIYMWNKPHAKVEDAKGIQISATQLFNEYSLNEQSANDKFLSKDHDKAIEVTGVVAETEKNMDGGLMVILETSDPTAGVQCALRDQNVSVAKGSQLNIKGYCSGSGITGVSLTDCIIVK